MTVTLGLRYRDMNGDDAEDAGYAIPALTANDVTALVALETQLTDAIITASIRQYEATEEAGAPGQGETATIANAIYTTWLRSNGAVDVYAIHAPKSSILLPNSNQMDMGNAYVLAWIVARLLTMVDKDGNLYEECTGGILSEATTATQQMQSAAASFDTGNSEVRWRQPIVDAEVTA